jgi:hypothetical protein
MITKTPLFTHEVHMIIKALDDGEYVDIEGPQLSMSESMASTQILSKLRLFMSRYPSLIVELLPIFGSLFRALQLQLDAEEGYSLPNSSRQTLIRDVLDHIMYMLQSYETSYGVVTSLLTTTRTARADASCNAEAIMVASTSAHSNRHINHRHDHDLGCSHEGRDHSDEGMSNPTL